MDKRKRRRKSVAIRTFGLRNVADHYEATPLYQTSFQEGDMAWLADEYRRRSQSEPSLTLEDFAAQYGAPADGIRAYVSELSRDVSHSIVLWHGTTKSRAESILREGFRVKRGKKQRRIFFAGRPSMAWGIAQSRASGEGDDPVVIRCSIDLSHYDDYEKWGRAVYAFRHKCIPSDVIEGVIGLPRQRSGEPERSERHDDTGGRFVNVTLTFNSGRAGIAYWINSCLKLDDDHRIGEDHEAVGEIKRWLDDQLDLGRFGEVPEDEVLEQIGKYLPQYLSGVGFEI